MKKHWKYILVLLAAAFLAGCENSPMQKEPSRETLPMPKNNKSEIQVESAAPVKDSVAWGTLEDMTFHTPDCPRLKNVDASKKRKFKSVYLALDADFHPCKECNPLK